MTTVIDESGIPLLKNSLTEMAEEDYNMEKYGIEYKRQYKIIDTLQTKTLEKTEELLNELAKEHWEVIGVTDHWIYLKRRTVNLINEGQGDE